MKIFSKNTTTKTWQIVSAILTVISISLSVFFFIRENSNEIIREKLEAKLDEKVNELIEAQVDLVQSELRIKEYQKIIDREKVLKDNAIRSMDSVLVVLAKKNKSVIELQKKIDDEKPIISDLDSDKQVRFFLWWSSNIDDK